MHSTAPAARSAANVSSTCHDACCASSTSGIARGQAASSPASRSSLALDLARDPEQDGPEALPERRQRLGQPGHGLAGSPYSARMLAPRCALTTNRNAGGVAAHQPSICSTVGRA